MSDTRCSKAQCSPIKAPTPFLCLRNNGADCSQLKCRSGAQAMAPARQPPTAKHGHALRGKTFRQLQLVLLLFAIGFVSRSMWYGTSMLSSLPAAGVNSNVADDDGAKGAESPPPVSTGRSRSLQKQDRASILTRHTEHQNAQKQQPVGGHVGSDLSHAHTEPQCNVTDFPYRLSVTGSRTNAFPGFHAFIVNHTLLLQDLSPGTSGQARGGGRSTLHGAFHSMCILTWPVHCALEALAAAGYRDCRRHR